MSKFDDECDDVTSTVTERIANEADPEKRRQMRMIMNAVLARREEIITMLMSEFGPDSPDFPGLDAELQSDIKLSGLVSAIYALHKIFEADTGGFGRVSTAAIVGMQDEIDPKDLN